jgi:GntR family transcriptional regulator
MPGASDDVAGLRVANARLCVQLAERDAEIAVLREQLAGLQSQVADLAARVRANSQNSSKPPSSDGLAKPPPKSLRGKSGRRPGRPKGQPGATMQLADHQLPSVREVVAVTAVNPNTVLKAYRDLEREGLVEARSGQGTFVRGRPPGPPPGTHARLGRTLAGWVREARAAGLDDEAIASLLQLTLQAAAEEDIA